MIQNGAGVLFTPTARIDVGGLVATSQQIDTDHLFATGGFRIGGGEQAGARVVNEGDITIRQAGLAALVGSDVENAGSIVAPLGTVALAAGTRTTIDLSGDGMFLVAVGNPEERAVRATQSGRIDVSGGHVVISAAGAARALDSVVNTSGVIRASSLTGRGGSVRLSSGRGGTTRVGGRVEARGAADGGSIWVLGKTVNVTTAAAIDASGARDGGEVRIGGDLRGLGGLLRAEDTTLAWGSEVRAEGGTGQGGLVVAWADGRTIFDGTISTRGGAGGGMTETSAKNDLRVGDNATVAGGRWLLDPTNVLIQNGGGANNIPPTTPPPGSASPYRISANSIRNALNTGTDVTISTVGTAGPDAGDISIASDINWSGSGNLAFTAAGGIDVRTGTIRAQGAGGLSFNAQGGSVTIVGSLTSGAQVRTNSGNIQVSARDNFALRHAISTSRNFQFFSQSGDLLIAVGNDIIIAGNASTSSGSWARLGNAGATGDIMLAASRVCVEGGGNTANFGAINGGGSLTITANEVVVQNGAATAQLRTNGGGDLTINAPVQTWNGIVSSGTGPANGGDVTLTGDITATVQPVFNLEPDANFTLASGTPGSFTSTTVPLEVTTRGTGTIGIGGPVTAPQVTLLSEEAVTVSSTGSLTGSGPGDALVVSAGNLFDNAAGAGAMSVTDPGARWLLYVNRLDNFANPGNTEPDPRDFNLYDRPYPSAASVAGFAGNRIVYAAQPTLNVIADDAIKAEGSVASLTFSTAGLRPGDQLSDALAGPVSLSSAGEPAPAPPGVYPIGVAATASAMGYALTTTDGTLTVIPVPVSPPSVIPPVILSPAVPPALALAAAPRTDPVGSLAGSVRSFGPGAEPLTPGDATFRTTQLDAAPAIFAPFALSYSLGEVTRATGPAGAATVAPAIPVDDGFVPAAGGLSEGAVAPTGPDGVATAGTGCAGWIPAGSVLAEGCIAETAEESYWTTRAETGS